ncbi:hypothetical protein BsWGS_26984 [Bradybaena similaris]
MIALVISSLLLFQPVYAASKYEPPEYWENDGREDILKSLLVKKNAGLAKNVVIMIGDGMGLPSVTAGRIYKGQKRGQTGEEFKLSFEEFPHVALSKTYNLDRQVPDSAGTATAIMTGVKVNLGTLGVNGDVPFAKSCATYNKSTHLTSVFDYALQAGKSVGFVTTARVTHATPGSTYAHTPHRDWESDSDIGNVPGCEQLRDIAYQLVLENPNIQVILGGGRRSFLNNTTPDPSTGKIHSNHRKDGLDLREVWKAEKKQRGVSHAYVETKGQLEAVDPEKTDYLFGLFHSNHMTYELERDNSSAGEPSLPEMTEKAIQILRKNPKGYILLVEGARIDHAHHNNSAKKALEELSVFDDAVILVKKMVSPVDTLHIVTADHSQVFFMGGYPSRGNNILGTVDIIDPGEGSLDNLPFLTLSYGNGPEFGRNDLTNVDTTANDFRQPGCLPMLDETHGGEEVAIYARGPMAFLFHSTHEQTFIGHVMMYSTCIGFYSFDCDKAPLKRVFPGSDLGRVQQQKKKER